jgi:hypothetical protein
MRCTTIHTVCRRKCVTRGVARPSAINCRAKEFAPPFTGVACAEVYRSLSLVGRFVAATLRFDVWSKDKGARARVEDARKPPFGGGARSFGFAMITPHCYQGRGYAAKGRGSTCHGRCTTTPLATFCTAALCINTTFSAERPKK